jgi:hypothetical protein
LIVGGLIFSSEINGLFPNTSNSVVESLKEDVGEISTKATESVEKRLDKSIDNVVEKTNEQVNSGINNVKESSKNILSNEVEKLNPVKVIENIFNQPQEFDDSEKPKTNSNDSSPKQNSPQNQEKNDSQAISYETLSLSTIQQSDENILLRYSDSSGKTESVSVTISTSEKEIFSGTFYAPMFETIVNNESGTPYFVDMIVDHQDYGKVSSSVYNPGDNSDSVINGIFSQS